LFFLNRYITPLQFLIIIDAFNDPRWTRSPCERFVAFEGGSTVGLVAVCELIMILRVYALYKRSRVILTSLLTLWVAQITISSIGLSTGFAITLPPGFVGCIFTGTSKIFPAIWLAPLITNSVMFFLTLYQSKEFLINPSHAPLLHIFVRDGTLYFLVIFMANLLNTLLYFLAVDDLKAIGASFSQLITATMISRLVLNLRSEMRSTSTPNYDTTSTSTRIIDRAIGHLGGKMDNFLANSETDEHDDANDLNGIPLTNFMTPGAHH